jgi:hypothetical protein
MNPYGQQNYSGYPAETSQSPPQPAQPSNQYGAQTTYWHHPQYCVPGSAPSSSYYSGYGAQQQVPVGYTGWHVTQSPIAGAHHNTSVSAMVGAVGVGNMQQTINSHPHTYAYPYHYPLNSYIAAGPPPPPPMTPAPSFLHVQNGASISLTGTHNSLRTNRKHKSNESSQKMGPVSKMSKVNKGVEERETAKTKDIIHTCDACDKSFTSTTGYEAHCANHEKCSHPGCEFVATKKVLMTHYDTVHGDFSGSGYKTINVEGMEFRVLMGTRPEDVSKWREDRKKRFPTSASREKVAESTNAVIQSGGLVPKTRLGEKYIQKEKKKDEEIIGINARIDQNKSEKDVPVENDDKNTETKSTKSHRMCHSFRSTGSCRHGDTCHYSHDIGSDPAVGTRNHKSNKIQLPPPFAGGLRGTLLKKLLKPEVDTEESLLLQCVRYLCTHSDQFEMASA